MIEIPAALRADLDQELATVVDNLRTEAARYDGMDVIDANVEMMNDLYARMTHAQLAAAAAALALRMHRAGDPRG